MPPYLLVFQTTSCQHMQLIAFLDSACCTKPASSLLRGSRSHWSGLCIAVAALISSSTVLPERVRAEKAGTGGGKASPPAPGGCGAPPAAAARLGGIVYCSAL
eukprot:18168-Heterococcus_DN1.PRE.2